MSRWSFLTLWYTAKHRFLHHFFRLFHLARSILCLTSLHYHLSISSGKNANKKALAHIFIVFLTTNHARSLRFIQPINHKTSSTQFWSDGFQLPGRTQAFQRLRNHLFVFFLINTARRVADTTHRWKLRRVLDTLQLKLGQALNSLARRRRGIERRVRHSAAAAGRIDQNALHVFELGRGRIRFEKIAVNAFDLSVNPLSKRQRFRCRKPRSAARESEIA